MRYVVLALLLAGFSTFASEVDAWVESGVQNVARGNRDVAESLFLKALLHDEHHPRALWELAKLDNNAEAAFRAYCLGDEKQRKEWFPTLSRLSHTSASIALAMEEYDTELITIILKGDPQSADLARKKLLLKHALPFKVSVER